MNAPKLPLHEWSIIILFCAILLLLAAHAFVGKRSVVQLSPLASLSPVMVSAGSKPEFVQVRLEGQVKKPGLYQMPLHATLKELLDLAELLPNADLSQLKWRRKLRDGQTIHIPEKKWIAIQVTGAVQKPGEHRILSGTRMNELADQIPLSPEADSSSLKRKRRFVKEGELIKINKKKANIS